MLPATVTCYMNASMLSVLNVVTQLVSYVFPQAAHCVLAQNPENVELARFYCFSQKTIAKRLVLRQ